MRERGFNTVVWFESDGFDQSTHINSKGVEALENPNRNDYRCGQIEMILLSQSLWLIIKDAKWDMIWVANRWERQFARGTLWNIFEWKMYDCLSKRKKYFYEKL